MPPKRLCRMWRGGKDFRGSQRWQPGAAQFQTDEIKERDLIRKLTVDLYKAVRGGEGKFLTLAGKEVALKIPAESQNGRSFRLKGQGFPACRRSLCSARGGTAHRFGRTRASVV